MVKCIVRGKKCELGLGLESPFPKIYNDFTIVYDGEGNDLEDAGAFVIDDNDDGDEDDADFFAGCEEVSPTAKIVAEELDESGKPSLKIVYIDPMDWRGRSRRIISNYIKRLKDAERDAAIDNPPRFIYVFQDKDYWPGTESDAQAMESRRAKEKEVVESGRRPYGGTLDHKEIRYDFDLNPMSPGYKFLVDNMPELKEQEQGETSSTSTSLVNSSSGLHSVSELKEMSKEETLKKMGTQKMGTQKAMSKRKPRQYLKLWGGQSHSPQEQSPPLVVSFSTVPKKQRLN